MNQQPKPYFTELTDDELYVFGNKLLRQLFNEKEEYKRLIVIYQRALLTIGIICLMGLLIIVILFSVISSQVH